ncbi:enoyl-CoA hydratase-related protein, partial [Algiphilus sp.]
MTTLNIDIDSQGIALLSIDLPDRSMNVITPELTSELDAAIDRIAGDDGIKGAIITSAKQGSFVAGADLKGMLASFDRGID